MFKNLSTRLLGITVTQSELIELSLSYGFKGIELDLPSLARRAESKGLDFARRLFDSARLRLSSFVLPLSVGEDEDTFGRQLASLEQPVRLAAELNCRVALGVIDPANDMRPFQENFELHRRRLAAIAAVLAPLEIRLGLEIVVPVAHRQARAYEFIHTLSALVQLVGMVDADNVGLTLDLWSAHACEEPDRWKSLDVEKIVAVLLADAPADKPPAELVEKDRLLPGETGEIDTSAALVSLAEMGYQGPLTVAPHRSRFAGATRDDIVKRTGEAIDGAWKAAGLNARGQLSATADS